MIWHIAKKEILENLTTYRFYILTGLLLVLMTVSIVISYGDYELRVEHYNMTKPGAGSSNVMLPPNPLSIFAKGAEANIGRLYWVHLGNIEVESSVQSINRLFALFTVPDMLFIIKVMLSLIALLFSFDAITEEKENGTIKLALASGTQRTSLLFGKLIGRFLLVILPFLILFFAATLVVSSRPDITADGDFWERVSIIAIFSALYTFVFTTLGLFLSSLLHRSPTSLIISLIAWVFFIFIAPQAGTAVAQAMSTIPPAERVELERRLTDVRIEYEHVLHERSAGEGTDNSRYANDTRDSYRQLVDSYRQKLNQRLTFTKDLVRVSPAGSLTLLLTNALNTGIDEELRLKDELWLYMDRNFDIWSGIAKGTTESFEYRRTTISELLSQSGMIDIVIIILFGLGFFTITLITFSRYDAR